MEVIKDFFIGLMRNQTFVGTIGVLVAISLIVIISMIIMAGIDMIAERKINVLLFDKLDLDSYIKEVNNAMNKTKNKNKLCRCYINKAVGMYYKGESLSSLEWMKEIKVKMPKQMNVYDIKCTYTLTLFKILLKIGYNEKVESIYKEKEDLINKLANSGEYSNDARFVKALYLKKINKLHESKDLFEALDKEKKTKLETIATKFELAMVYTLLDRGEEAEKLFEEILDQKRRKKNLLYIFDEIEEFYKSERRKSSVRVTIDFDLEETMKKNALEKMNKDVEYALEKFSKPSDKKEEKSEEKSGDKVEEIKQVGADKEKTLEQIAEEQIKEIKEKEEIKQVEIEEKREEEIKKVIIDSIDKEEHKEETKEDVIETSTEDIIEELKKDEKEEKIIESKDAE